MTAAHSHHNAHSQHLAGSQKKMSRESLREINQLSTGRKVALVESLNFSKQNNFYGKNPVSSLDRGSCQRIIDTENFRPPSSISATNHNTRRPQIIINNYLIGEKNTKDSYISNSIVINDRKKKLSPVNNSVIESNMVNRKGGPMENGNMKDNKIPPHKNPLRQFFDGVGHAGWSSAQDGVQCRNELKKRGHKKNALSMLGSDTEWISKLNLIPGVSTAGGEYRAIGAHDKPNVISSSGCLLNNNDKRKDGSTPDVSYLSKSNIPNRKKKKGEYYSKREKKIELSVASVQKSTKDGPWVVGENQNLKPVQEFHNNLLSKTAAQTSGGNSDDIEIMNPFQFNSNAKNLSSITAGNRHMESTKNLPTNTRPSKRQNIAKNSRIDLYKDAKSRIKEINNNIHNSLRSHYNHSTSMHNSGGRNYAGGNGNAAAYLSNNGSGMMNCSTNVNSQSMINNSGNNLNSKVSMHNFFKQNPLEIYPDNNPNLSLDIRTTLEHQTNSTRPSH